MTNAMKRITGIITVIEAVLLCAILTPGGVTARAETRSGSCGTEGSNVTWTLDGAGKLTI